MASRSRPSSDTNTYDVPISAFVFAIVGFLFIAAKTISFARLWFSLFIFPGTSVSTTDPIRRANLPLWYPMEMP